jgi:hypothetical protein
VGLPATAAGDVFDVGLRAGDGAGVGFAVADDPGDAVVRGKVFILKMIGGGFGVIVARDVETSASTLLAFRYAHRDRPRSSFAFTT